MQDEDKLNRASVRGTLAEALLQNELLKGSFVGLRKTYTEAWAQTQPDEMNAREYYWRAIQVLDDVENHLKKIARDGRVAKQDIEALAKGTRS